METALKIASYSDVMKMIGTWTPDRRFMLVKDVLNTLEPEFQMTRPKRRQTLNKALGLLATNQPAPSDQEIKQWLDEYKLEKYG